MAKDYIMMANATLPKYIRGYTCPPSANGAAMAHRWLLGMERGWWSACDLPMAVLHSIIKWGQSAISILRQLHANFGVFLESCIKELDKRCWLKEEMRRPRPVFIKPRFVGAGGLPSLRKEFERKEQAMILDKINTAPTIAPKPVPVPDVERYKAGLRRRGWKVVGKGAYSTVYVHNAKPGVAIKVNGGQTGNDDWVKFAVWASKFRKSPFIRVFAIHRHNGFTAALMERIEGDSYDGVSTLEIQKQEQTKEIIEHYRFGSGLRVLVEDDMVAVAANARLRWARRRAGTRVIAALRLLAKHNSIDDLHRKNWGYRPDGSTVIFDPSTCYNGAIAKVEVPDRWSSYTYNKAEGLKEAA